MSSSESGSSLLIDDENFIHAELILNTATQHSWDIMHAGDNSQAQHENNFPRQ